MNVDELLEQYMNDPKWKGKLFMEDEKTCYTDGLLIGLFLAQKEHALLKQQISQLKNDLIVARKDREDLKDVIATSIEGFMKDNPSTSLQFLADRESREKIEQLEKQICELQSEISSLKEQKVIDGNCKSLSL